MGELVARFPLMEIRNDRGDDFRFTLTHRNIGNPNGNGALGWGWDASWLRHLEADGSDYQFHTGDGRTLRFSPVGGGAFQGPPGSYAKLVPGSGGDLELRDRDGNVQVFDDALGYRLVKVVDSTGNVWSLEYSTAHDGLSRIIDPHDRAITFTYITDGLSVNPFYAVHGQPLLRSITDFDGRQTLIEYDHSTGTIHSIITPDRYTTSTTITRFGYDDFGIIKIWDNEGQEYLRVLYDEHGRVRAQERLDGEGDTHRHGFTYAYDEGRTVTHDPEGNEVAWSFPNAGSGRVLPDSKTESTRGLRTGGLADPAQYVTTYDFNGNDELTLVTFPRGNSVQYEYDEAAASLFSRGNLLREIRDPGDVRALRDTGHHQQQVVTEYTYDPTYNVVTKIVEPRGTDAAHVPQNGGTRTPARFTTEILYDFHEAAAGTDLNGDGVVTTEQDRRPIEVRHPTIHPAGNSDVHGTFSTAYKDQAHVERLTWNAAGQLVKREDPRGIKETRTYYPSNGVSLDASDREGYLEKVVVDDGGLSLSTTYEYAPYGTVTKVTDPRGNARLFTLDGRGRVSQETGPAPTFYHTAWTYDDNDNVVALARDAGDGTGLAALREYAYDDLDRLVEETVHASRPTAVATALSNQPTPHPEVYATQYAYDGNDNLVQRTNGAGDVETWRYDERGLLLFQEVGPGNGTYAYDDNGNLLVHQDPRGAVTWVQHDGYDRPSARIDAHGTVRLTHYDPAGNVVRERGFAQAWNGNAPAGRPTPTGFSVVDASATEKQYERTYRYDEAGQPYRVDEEHFLYGSGQKASTAGTLSPGDAWVTTLREYDANGQPTRTVDDNGHETTRAYDRALRLAATEDHLGNRVVYTYDGNGNVATTTTTPKAGGVTTGTYTTTYTHDPENRLKTVVNPDGTTRSYAYDGRGNLLTATDELGNVVRTVYDHADRPWVVQRELHAGGTGAGSLLGVVETTTHWDGADRPVQRCDGNDACTTYAYAGATGLLRSETHPDGVRVQYAYDAGGNRAQTTYNNGRTLSMTYDDLNRLTQLDVDRDAGTLGTTQQRFTYDAMGRLTQSTDNGVLQIGRLSRSNPTATTHAYDSLGRLVSEAQNAQGVQHVRDGVGNAVQTTYPNGRVVSRAFDALDRLQSVEDAKGFIAGLQYDGDIVIKKTFGSNPSPVAVTTMGYDDMRRVGSVQHRDAASLSLAHVGVEYNDAGHRFAQYHFSGSGTELDQLLGLDSLYRTTSWQRGDLDAPPTSITNVQDSDSWSLDAANNWDMHAGCTRAHGAGNEVLSETCGTNVETYSYDANGNLQEDGDFEYGYDFLNRLVRVDSKATGEALVAFGYDALGRRVVKVSNEPQPTPVGPGPRAPVETWFTYSGQDAVQESQPLRAKADPFNPTAFSPSVRVIRQWTHGDGVDEVLEMTVDENDGFLDASDARYYYVYDAHGSVLGLTDEAGDLVEGYTYDPYGKPTIRRPGAGFNDVQWDSSDIITTTGPGLYENPFLFTGRYWDTHIDKYHYRARTYDPELGRFLSRDPIGVWGDEGNLGNAYAYVGNSPWQYTDPYGLCPACAGAVVGAAVGALWQFGSYSYTVATTDATWNNQALSDDLKVGLIAGAVIGATGGLGASAVGAVAASGASAGAVFGTTVAVGAAEGVVGQAAFDKLDDGAFNDGWQTYTGAAAFGAVTAGAGYGAGALWKTGRGARAGIAEGSKLGSGDDVILAGGQSFHLTEHAAERLVVRGITHEALIGALEQRPFSYAHSGVTKQGYFDPTTQTFAGTVDGQIATVIQGSRVQPYVEKLGWKPWK